MTTKKDKYLNLVLYIVCFLAIILTPYGARLISPMFDWVGYGALEGFFDELFTCILWLVEIVIIAVIYTKKLGIKILYNDEAKGQELPVKRILILSGIVVACILVISAQIRFQVKPFYDLGEKFNGYELLNNVGIFLRNIIKCIWIVIMLKAAQSFVEQFFAGEKSKFAYAGLIMMLTVGIYDIVMGMNNLAVTYLFLYLIYGMIYLLTDRNTIKTYLLIVLIYLF